MDLLMIGVGQKNVSGNIWTSWAKLNLNYPILTLER